MELRAHNTCFYPGQNSSILQRISQLLYPCSKCVSESGRQDVVQKAGYHIYRYSRSNTLMGPVQRHKYPQVRTLSQTKLQIPLTQQQYMESIVSLKISKFLHKIGNFPLTPEETAVQIKFFISCHYISASQYRHFLSNFHLFVSSVDALSSSWYKIPLVIPVHQTVFFPPAQNC